MYSAEYVSQLESSVAFLKHILNANKNDEGLARELDRAQSELNRARGYIRSKGEPK